MFGVDPFIIVALVWLVTTIASRVIAFNSLNLLNDEQKVSVIDYTSKQGRLNLFILLGVLVVFFAVIKFQLLDWQTAGFLYLAIILVHLTVIGVLAYKHFKALNFPNGFIFRHVAASVIRNIGIAVLIILIIQL